jgi:hypothetical protein
VWEPSCLAAAQVTETRGWALLWGPAGLQLLLHSGPEAEYCLEEAQLDGVLAGSLVRHCRCRGRLCVRLCCPVGSVVMEVGNSGTQGGVAGR